jgi:hypothetical protein
MCWAFVQCFDRAPLCIRTEPSRRLESLKKRIFGHLDYHFLYQVLLQFATIPKAFGSLLLAQEESKLQVGTVGLSGVIALYSISAFENVYVHENNFNVVD